ncbi:MAG: NTP transferase domain-containing protein [candidate division WOR-3 bacterium]|nr:MAG: NTP transferase domain-containing protein [candidate division WOR-3 bacterium]
MNIIIPVAGEGTRLRPHTHIIPKSLLYVAGKPILAHILDGFQELNISQIVIVLGAMGEAIIDFCEKYPYDFKFVLQEERLGLGHAIYTGARGLTGATMVLLGDTIIDYNFKTFCRGTTNVLAVKEVADPKRFGIVEVDKNNVTNLVEKPRVPKSNLAIIGLYYFQQIAKVYNAVDYLMKKGIKTRGEYQLTDALKYLLKKGEKFRAVKVDKWYDCGTAAALIKTNHHLLQKTHHFKKRKNTIVVPPVYIDDSADIIGSIIGPNVSIGEDVIIKNSIIKDSIVNRNAKVENALLSESIIGEKAVVKGGFKKLSVSDSSVIEFP